MSLAQTWADRSDALRKVPDQLEGLIGEKRYLEAAVMLVRNSKTCHRADLVEVGALADLRAYFKAQETVRREEDCADPRPSRILSLKSCRTMSISKPTPVTPDGRQTPMATRFQQMAIPSSLTWRPWLTSPCLIPQSAQSLWCPRVTARSLLISWQASWRPSTF